MADQTYNVNDPEFIKNLTGIATAQTQPTTNIGLQSISDQQGVLKQNYDLGGNQLSQNTNEANQAYDTVANNLIKNAANSTGSLEENYNNLGLLRSGMNAAGLGDIQSTLNKNQGLNEQGRANKLANIAIQRAGLTNTYNSGMANTELNKTLVNTNANQSINDIVSKLLSGSQTAAGATPQGKTTYIPGIGYVQGTQAPVYKDYDLGDKIVTMDSQGNIVKTMAKSATPSGLKEVDLGNKTVMVDSGGNIVKEYKKGLTPSAAQPKEFKSPSYTTANDNAGGLMFFNENKKPISVTAYLQGMSPTGQFTRSDMANTLSQSNNPNDIQLLKDLKDQNISLEDIQKKYPWLFQ